MHATRTAGASTRAAAQQPQICHALPLRSRSAAVASVSCQSAASCSQPQAQVSWPMHRQAPGRRATSLRSTSLDAPTTVTVNNQDLDVSGFAAGSIQYAIDFSRVSETYEVHSWMLLLGLLRQEKSTAAAVLKDLGMDDLYGAWHEVLWALHSSDGLVKRSFVQEIGFSERAYFTIRGAMNFARWHGKDKVNSEDLLMALAAGGVLEGLFPDLPMKFDKVRKAVEKATGRKYAVPEDGDAENSTDGSDSEIFL